MEVRNTDMKRLIAKLKDPRGESLLELLVSILIGSMSIVLLTTMIVTAVRIDKSADLAEKLYYESLTSAEGMQGTSVNSQVKIEGLKNGTDLGSVTVNVECFGRDGIFSYKKK